MNTRAGAGVSRRRQTPSLRISMSHTTRYHGLSVRRPSFARSLDCRDHVSEEQAASVGASGTTYIDLALEAKTRGDETSVFSRYPGTDASCSTKRSSK